MFKILSFLKSGKAIYMLAALAMIAALSWFKFHIDGLNETIKEKEQTIKDKETLLIAAKAQGEISKSNLGECNAKIDLQNERIKSVSLDNEALKKQIKKAKASAKARYENLKPPDINANCEEKLNLALSVIKGLGKKD